MSDRMGEIRGRLAAATPGPWAAEFDACSQCGGEWWVDGPPGGRHAQFAMKADAEVISNAPADLAWLIGEVEREKARADAAEAALATAAAAGFARGVEESAQVAETPDDMPASRLEIAAAIRALVPS